MNIEKNSNILSKFNKEGLHLIYWISSVLSLAFLIRLIIGGINNTIFHGYSIINELLNGSNPKNELIWLITLYVISLLVLFIPYVLTRIISKLAEKNQVIKIERRKLYFATGVYFVIINIPGIIGILNTIISLLFNSRWGWGVHVNASHILDAIIYSLIPFIYIFVGFSLIKKSKFLNTKTEIELDGIN